MDGKDDNGESNYKYETILLSKRIQVQEEKNQIKKAKDQSMEMKKAP